MSQDDDATIERVARATSPWPAKVQLGAHVFQNSYDDGSYYCYELRASVKFADPAALSAMPQRELLSEALAYAHQLEQCVAEFLDAYTAFNNDELDEVSMNDAENGMKLAMYAFREARAAADKIRAALEHQP